MTITLVSKLETYESLIEQLQISEKLSYEDDENVVVFALKGKDEDKFSEFKKEFRTNEQIDIIDLHQTTINHIIINIFSLIYFGSTSTNLVKLDNMCLFKIKKSKAEWLAIKTIPNIFEKLLFTNTKGLASIKDTYSTYVFLTNIYAISALDGISFVRFLTDEFGDIVKYLGIIKDIDYDFYEAYTFLMKRIWETANIDSMCVQLPTDVNEKIKLFVSDAKRKLITNLEKNYSTNPSNLKFSNK